MHVFASIVAVDVLVVFVSECIYNDVILSESSVSLQSLLSLFPYVVYILYDGVYG